jgi:hypothetical protein
MRRIKVPLAGWRHGGGNPLVGFDEVEIEARHEPMYDAVQYRVTWPDRTTGERTMLVTSVSRQILVGADDSDSIFLGVANSVLRNNGPSLPPRIFKTATDAALAVPPPPTAIGLWQIASPAGARKVQGGTMAQQARAAFRQFMVGGKLDTCEHSELKWRAIDAAIEVGECAECGKVRKATRIGE